MDGVQEHEITLTTYAIDALGDRFGTEIRIYGPPAAEDRGGVISFTFRDLHPHDIAQLLDNHGVCVRAGHHCAKPLMRCLGVGATARASFYLYNDEGSRHARRRPGRGHEVLRVTAPVRSGPGADAPQ